MLKISARVSTQQGEHRVAVSTNGSSRPLEIAPKTSGIGSSVNGGELLFAALATCYCNDVLREAAKRGIEVESVDVEVDGEFGGEGEAARRVAYRARIRARAPESAIRELARHTDRVAEIQNTLRAGMPVALEDVVAESRGPEEVA
jgi:organic hydroperoxide reductase OsmC/OhrA